MNKYIALIIVKWKAVIWASQWESLSPRQPVMPANEKPYHQGNWWSQPMRKLITKATSDASQWECLSPNNQWCQPKRYIITKAASDASHEKEYHHANPYHHGNQWSRPMKKLIIKATSQWESLSPRQPMKSANEKAKQQGNQPIKKLITKAANEASQCESLS